MASRAPAQDSSKTAKETEAAVEVAAATPAAHAGVQRTLSMADLTLRLLLFAMTLTAVVVVALSEQTKVVASPLLPFPLSFKAKFTHSSAIIYSVVALSVACVHSLVSSAVRTLVIAKPSLSARLLLRLAFVDTVMAGVVASATGAVASIAYIALKGNSHVGWNKVCNVFDKFCRHIAGSIVISLVSSITLVLLVMISTYSLYLRCHKAHN